ncbi:Alpha/Beta hydrolase protein [Lasiosphaeris hirsuta]|uniref:Carboxylic ester hydrolase n=1 Tax=Lasiosphaeris hirsuta TaxID=260670 RepID=A0AA40A2M7_9PEZI|nr:Alpha/Beta hydrolase protein [Lasiosphaeris hirsuta]
MRGLTTYPILGLILALACLSRAAKLTQVASGWDNPTKLSFYIYVPDKLAPKPPVIIVPHPCGGSAQDTFSRVATGLSAQADKLGFILIFPQTPNTCWDCSSTKSLKHNGGGDTQGMVNMVQYTLTKYSGDAARVFVTGSSSGGMATNALIATYPDVFAAGASFSGAPAFACWNGAGLVSAANMDAGCQTNKRGTTAQQWGDLVRAASPGFNGTRPAMQIWHGTTDTVVAYGYLSDQLAEWGNVLGVAFAKNVTGDPLSGYTKMVYGDGMRLVGYSAQGVGHIVPFREKEVLQFFGLL